MLEFKIPHGQNPKSRVLQGCRELSEIGSLRVARYLQSRIRADRAIWKFTQPSEVCAAQKNQAVDAAGLIKCAQPLSWLIRLRGVR